MKYPIKLLLITITLTTLTLSQPTPKPLTQQKLKQITQFFDNIHYFIILDQQLLPQLIQHLPLDNNIQYYTHNCIQNKQLLKTCQPHHDATILLIYNKVSIEYSIRIKNQQLTTITQWLHLTLTTNPIINPTQPHLLSILHQQTQLFILVENKTIHDLKTAYQNLAKQFPLKNFIYLQNLTLAESYNLTIGNFLHIKNIRMQLTNTLQPILENQTMTTFLPQQMKRYQTMKLFVYQNILTRGFTKNMENIDHYRFNLKITNQSSQQPQIILYIICDPTKPCINYLTKLDQQLFNLNPKPPHLLFRRIFYRFETIKLVQLLQVYYHIKLRNLQLPYLLVLNGQDPDIPSLPLRYSKQLNLYHEQPLQQILHFLQQINQNTITKFTLTSPLPKKNGFYGKGSQKTIQKLTYNTYKTILSTASQQNKFYLLYITSFDFDCPQCTSFYNQYKKLSSFINAENHLPITFGVFDLSKDQIDLPYLKNVPMVLLFSPYAKQPIEYHSRYDFETLHQFLKKQIRKQILRHQQKQQQQQEKIISQGENIEEL